MPSTRHSTGSTRATGPSKGQSTLSFHNKVTKNINHDAKKSSVVSPSVTKVTPPTPVEVEPTKDEVEEIENEEPDEEVKPEKSESEINAEKVSDAQIGKYWKGIEKERRSPRIHQQGLSDHEKILRYFDVSSQYGPCIGIDRRKRWERADRLGLNPPIEVLAVLLQEEQNNVKGYRTSQMEKIMGSIAVGSSD